MITELEHYIANCPPLTGIGSGDYPERRNRHGIYCYESWLLFFGVARKQKITGKLIMSDSMCAIRRNAKNKPTKNYLFIINQFSELKNVAISHIKNNERNKGSLGFSHT